MRSSAGYASAGRFRFTVLLLDSIADQQQTQPEALLDGAPQAAGQDEREKGSGRAEADQVPRSALREGGLYREQEDRAQDGALERAQPADQHHEDHVGGPLHAEHRPGLDEERVRDDEYPRRAAAQSREHEA